MLKIWWTWFTRFSNIFTPAAAKTRDRLSRLPDRFFVPPISPAISIVNPFDFSKRSVHCSASNLSAPTFGGWAAHSCGRPGFSVTLRGSVKGPIRTSPSLFIITYHGTRLPSVPFVSISCLSAPYFHGGNTGSNPVGDAKQAS